MEDSTAGIVAEYNPFHNGHQYQIDQLRQQGVKGVIAVMSGHFLQRGEPALADKWQRAKWAVAGGADLVIELPLTIACRSADYFAAGAVRLLASLGVVTHLSFGAESALPTLEELAYLLHTAETQTLLREQLSAGLSYPAALQKAIEKTAPSLTSALRQPNNILGLSYLNALNTYAPSIRPLPIARAQNAYHAITISGRLASASAIRTTLVQKGFSAELQAVVPAATWQGLRDSHTAQQLLLDHQILSQLLFYRLRLDKIAGRLPVLGEGLENRLEKTLSRTSSCASLLEALKSKRYPRARLARQLTHYLLDTPSELLHRIDREGPPYARVLAFNDAGRQLLHRCRKTSSLPLVTRVAPFFAGASSLSVDCLRQDMKATECYMLLTDAQNIKKGDRDFTTSPFYCK